MRVPQWASFGSRRTIRGGEAGAACGSSGNASAWPAPRESRVDDDGQLSRFALLRLVGLDGSRTSRECSSNTQGGSVSRDGKQPLAITSSRTHAGKLAEATRIKGMLILRSAARGRKPKDRSLRPLVPAPGPLRPKPRLRLSAGPWLPRQTAPCFPLRAWICFNSLEKACCVSPQACKPNTGIIGFRVRGRTKCQPQTLIRAARNSVSSKEKETLTRLLRFALAAQCARLDWLAADRSRLSKPRGSLLIALSEHALSLVGWIRRAVRRRAMQNLRQRREKSSGAQLTPPFGPCRLFSGRPWPTFFGLPSKKAGCAHGGDSFLNIRPHPPHHPEPSSFCFLRSPSLIFLFHCFRSLENALHSILIS